MISFKFAYLTGAVLFGIVWVFLFFRRPDLRREQLLLSFIVGIMGFTEPLFVTYWRPEFLFPFPFIKSGIEALLLCFAYGGIASVIYEDVFRIKLKRDFKDKRGLFSVAIAVTIGTFVFLVLYAIGTLNIIYVHSFSLLLGGALLVIFRKDMLSTAILTGIVMALLSFIVLLILSILYPGIFAAWWNLDALSGILVINVPVEELLWHFSLGFAVGPIYEILKGYHFKK